MSILVYLNKVQAERMMQAYQLDQTAIDGILSKLYPENKNSEVHKDRIASICAATAAGTKIWENGNPYSFMCDPEYTVEHVTLLVIVSGTPLFSLIGSKAYDKKQIAFLLGMFKQKVSESVAYHNYGWLCNPDMDSDTMRILYEWDSQAKDSAIATVVNFGDLTTYSTSRQRQLHWLAQNYMKLGKRFLRYDFGNIFTPDTVKYPGFVAQFLAKFANDEDTALMEQYALQPDLAMEIAEWVTRQYKDTEQALNSCLQHVAEVVNVGIDVSYNPANILRTFRDFKIRCSNANKKFPLSFYQYTDISTLREVGNAYIEGLIFERDLRSRLTLGDIARLRENQANGTKQTFGTAIVNVPDNYFKKFEFSIDWSKVDTWAQDKRVTLRKYLADLRILQSYSLDSNSEPIRVEFVPMYDYTPWTATYDTMEVQKNLPRQDFDGQQVLVRVWLEHASDVLPRITVYL